MAKRKAKATPSVTHTPGPWELQESHMHGLQVVDTTEGYTVCLLSVYGMRLRPALGEDAANGRLIATAHHIAANEYPN